MNILQAIVLGLVQGLTEFIPVSSSGHLVLLHELFGLEGVGLAFDVALHFGTLMALVIYFRKEIVQLMLGVLGKNEFQKLAWFIAAATIPAVIAGVLLQEAAETTLRDPRIVAFNLILVAVFMLYAEKYAKNKKHQTELKKTSFTQAMIGGLAQATALVPGVSRSGATITAGLFAGLDRVSATRFSFLLGIPILFGATLKVLTSDSAINSLSQQPDLFIAGVVSALLSGIFAIKFLLKYLSNNTLAIFAYYRIALGILTIAIAV